MRFWILSLTIILTILGCQSPYRPTQIPPPGTGTVGRRDPYYQPNARQLGARESRSPAYTARARQDRRHYNSDDQKSNRRDDTREADDTDFDDTSLDTSSTSASANSLVKQEYWRDPAIADNGYSDSYISSRPPPGFRR